MGFSFDNRGCLCCDACPVSGGVRKRPCPFGYCPSRALCKACYARTKAAGEHTKAAHASCERRADEYKARERDRAAILASGKAVRCSALNAGPGRVHVLFRFADGSTIGRYVTSEAYDAVPFNVPATPETYALYGEVSEAPGSFSYESYPVKNLE